MNSPLQPEDFSVFFRELWGENRDAFPWQKDFARRIGTGDWPKYVAAPTGSGKTACIDAAVFALAIQSQLPTQERTAGRRIFFIVNRRVIVDEAYERAGELCQKLIDASPETVVGRVAEALRSLTGESGGHPLTRTQLRGGIYRDRSWAGSLLQPMIICSTVDQAGSRLLFRGYGVSDQARPIHAALVAQDSVLIVDEAHISRPFTQTLDWVRSYRLHEPAGCETIRLPFQFVQMTATPPAGTSEAEQIALTAADHEHLVLKPRLCGAKRASLVVEDKAKGKVREDQMAKRLAKEARQILAEHAPQSLAVMVNRVATARAVASELRKDHGAEVTLLIGRLRPLDREALTRKIQDRLKTGAVSQDVGDGPVIVVSTQCLEVGADLDFDALVTEAASLDALRQRFGRLNRGGREITPRAMIVLPGDQNLAPDKLDDKAPCDPIYGNAIPRTWLWLQSITENGEVDFGINAMAAQLKSFRETNGDDALSAMLSPTGDAPVLLPAYLDCWVQTNPTPAADPDVALFLHGPQRDMAEVQVCWRADLPDTFNKGTWTDTLSLCPPTTAECLPVPLHIFRAWAAAESKFEDLSGDAGERVEAPERKELEKSIQFPALIWRGPEKSRAAEKISDIAPGDTIVLRTQGGGWQSLGILPDAPADPSLTPDALLAPAELRTVDVAERGIADARRRAVLRIHPRLWPVPESGTAAAELMDCATNGEKDWHRSEIKVLLARLLNDETPGWPLDETQRKIVEHFVARKKLSELLIDSYPAQTGFVISTRVLMEAKNTQNFESADAEPEALLEAPAPQELCDHTQDVLDRVASSLALLPLTPWKDALTMAAALHDWGKADVRFQALLRSSSVFAAMASGVVLAKSGNLTSSFAAYSEACARAGLPKGFRHEMLSVQMAESEVGKSALPAADHLRALTLHLIATHHGYARPFAPVVEDDTPPEVSLPMEDQHIVVTSAERTEHFPHALDSGLAERFWQMNRRYGWWGLALLEAVLRLADQTASAKPSKP
ncbi:MAG: type I-U CRISPR-associated helicase/endonuclease Cas3 [Chthoniobacteraceae bacterium]